ncbi:glycosyl hydrolase family 18 protein [Paenibacillus sp. LHD-117]|uniref:glycosyl hydrolase family 18 protein n=1 Tax=Paenibacillus sp. LHD-117 TaxID=3071412 RepID=UPI0027DFD4F7|nr:glycosyl hydrolase family 18 protein [Paenibacillus sp. LHD-117]MDQ6418855.1 glycosyl hydrolase family 18 protein [Paenibacillus sp. LHD-117]
MMMKRWMTAGLSALLVLASFVLVPPQNEVLAAPNQQVYEAESGTIGSGAAVASKSNASGGSAIGSMHFNNAYNQVQNVNGGQAGGKYELTIRFATGDAVATKALYVNGSKVAYIEFKSTGGWNTFVNKTVEVTLNPGATNSIKLQNDGGQTFTYGVEIDNYSLSPKTFKVAGYIHPKSFSNNDIDSAAFDYITDVILIGFHTLDTSGNIVTRTDDPDLANWPQYVDTMHQAVGSRSVKKWITLNADASTMAQVVGNPTARANYIAQVGSFLTQYGFDGVDIDWEYPSGSTQWNNFSTTIIEMQQALGKNGKSISLALSAWGVSLSANAFASVDHINYMNYDAGYYHAPFENSRSGINYFLNLGVPKEKINLGLAWYGRPFDGSAYWLDYDEINAQTSITPETDIVYNFTVGTANGNPVVKNVYFNGIDMNKRKMLLAQDMEVGGVMMWHLFADAPVSDSKSLLKAITDEKNGHQAYRSMTNLAANQWYYANVSDSGYGAHQVFDGNDKTTYWQAPAGVTSDAYLQLDFKQVTTLNTVVLKEHGNNVRSFKVQNWSGGQWVDVYSGGLMGAYKVISFPAITTGNIRVLITSAELPNIPSGNFSQFNKLGIYEFEVYNK